MSEGYTDVEREYLQLSEEISDLKKVLADVLAESHSVPSVERRTAAMKVVGEVRAELEALLVKRAALEMDYVKARSARFKRDLKSDREQT